MCKIILRMRSRPVARLFYGEVRSNKETDQRVWRGKSLGRGELCLSENELCSKFAIGGAHFECISVSQLGGSRPSEMAGNAFKTNMVWWNYILSTKNIAIKKRFSKKTCVALNRSFNILQATQRAGSSICQSWREFSYLPTVKITIQIQCFAENYGKQTPKGILLRNQTMSCRHTKSSFYTLRRLRHILWKESSLETQEQSVGSGEKAGQKFSSMGERAPGYRLLPDHFQNFRRMPAPDWAQKMLCIIVPNRRTHLQSSFHVFVHEGYCLDHGLCGSCTKEMHAVRKLSVWYKIPIWFQITVCLKTKNVFPKNTSFSLQQVFTLASAKACIYIYEKVFKRYHDGWQPRKRRLKKWINIFFSLYRVYSN